MTRDQLIKTMARAIHDEYHQGGQTWDEAHAGERIMCRSMVTAALTAIEAAGMRVVPVEPSEKMLAVVHDKKRSWGFLNPRELYRIMVLAAQEDSTSE